MNTISSSQVEKAALCDVKSASLPASRPGSLPGINSYVILDNLLTISRFQIHTLENELIK